MRTLPALLVILFASLYMGCSSAEQTTAKLAYQNGDYAKAETEFAKETQQNPANEEAWFYLGLSRIKLNKVKEAKDAMDQYRKLGKNTFSNEMLAEWGTTFDDAYKTYKDADVQFKAKDTINALKTYNVAVKKYQAALILEPDSLDAKRNADAISSKISLITVNPILNKAASLLDAGSYQEAIDLFTKVKSDYNIVNDNPAYNIVQINLAIAYSKWGAKLQTDNPDDQNTYKEKYSQALPILEELKNTNNKDDRKTVYQLLVPVYGNLGMTDKATEAIKIRDELMGK